MTKTVGENIRYYRKLSGITQLDLSKKIGVSLMSVRRYESGERLPTIEIIGRIANALNIPIVKIKEDLTWGEHRQTEELNQLEKSTFLFQGIIASLEKIYGFVQEKSVVGNTGWERPYWLVGENPNTFILYESDIDTLVKSMEATIPILVERLKDSRPEIEIVQEITNELNKIKTPEK